MAYGMGSMELCSPARAARSSSDCFLGLAQVVINDNLYMYEGKLQFEVDIH